MAKVSFGQISPIKEIEDKKIMFNDKEIIIKQYLSVKDKAELVNYIIQSSFDENGLFSPVRQRIYTIIGFLKWYTNINFTDTMMQNIERTYDLIILNHLDKLVNEIDVHEYSDMLNMITEAVIETKDHLRSFAGQLRAVKSDYDDTSLDMDKIISSLQDPEQIGFVKELMAKMG